MKKTPNGTQVEWCPLLTTHYLTFSANLLSHHHAVLTPGTVCMYVRMYTHASLTTAFAGCSVQVTSERRDWRGCC